jgi:phosphatidylserine decarboxylase
MRRLALIVIVGLFVTAATAADWNRPSNAQAALRVVDQRPFTVQGRNFRAHERVKVTLYKQQKNVRTRAVTASLSGTFRAVLQQTPVDRCDLIRVRAVGAAGSTAVLKMLPQPACHSD